MNCWWSYDGGGASAMSETGVAAPFCCIDRLKSNEEPVGVGCRAPGVVRPFEFQLVLRGTGSREEKIMG